MYKEIIEVTKGVMRNEGSNNLFFSPGQYDILIRKEGCEDIAAKLVVSDTAKLSEIYGGEMTIEDSVISCDMECD